MMLGGLLDTMVNLTSGRKLHAIPSFTWIVLASIRRVSKVNITRGKCWEGGEQQGEGGSAREE